MAREIRIDVAEAGTVTGLLEVPGDAWVLYILAHGAGAGMRHAFMEHMAAALAQRGVATLRYQFPYTEAGRRRPDRPPLLEATVRAAVAAAADSVPSLPRVAGGKSMGGRMTARAQADAPLPGVRGLAFLGFPLQPAGRPGVERAEHLYRVRIPMLFLQGTRDALAPIGRMGEVCASLGAAAVLHEVEGADHGFAVLKRSGRTADAVLTELADALAAWAADVSDADR